MTQPSLPDRQSRVNVTGVLTAAGGLVLLAVVIRQVGAANIVLNIRQVGWGLVAIIAIGGLRFLLRAIAWRLCLEPPHTMPLRDAFAAVICGDAIGNLTPLGPLVGEPAKAAFVRGRVPVGPAVTALVIENVLYTLSAAAMIAGGMVALLVRFQLPAVYARAGEVAVGATLALFIVALWLLWRQPAIISRALRFAPPLRKHEDRIRELESQVYTFASRHPSALVPLAMAELGFHAFGVAEVYLTLWLLNVASTSLLTAFLFETANRLITVLFKFIPLRLGVDETGTAMFAQLIGLTALTGLSLGIIRRARVLFWAAAGGILLVREGFVSRSPRVPPGSPEHS
jgi:hypothetical protein